MQGNIITINKGNNMSRFNSFFQSISIASVIVFLLSLTIFAQDSVSVRGKYALQFQFASNFQLTSFNGTTISGKYTFSNGDAVRAGLSINGTSTTLVEDNNTNQIFNPNEYKTKLSSNGYGITLIAQYLYYNSLINDVSFYYGGGPLAGISYNKTNNTGNVSGINPSEVIIQGWTLGVSLVCGVDWFISKRLSLSAEYGFVASYDKTIENAVTASPQWDQQTNYGYQFGGNNVKIGLSIYF